MHARRHGRSTARACSSIEHAANRNSVKPLTTRLAPVLASPPAARACRQHSARPVRTTGKCLGFPDLDPRGRYNRAAQPGDVASGPVETCWAFELVSVITARCRHRLVHGRKRRLACDHLSAYCSGCVSVRLYWWVDRLAHAKGSQETHTSETGTVAEMLVPNHGSRPDC